MTNFNDYVARLKSRHGDKFSDAGLAAKFAPYFGQRIEVRHHYGEVSRGWVTGTTGWQPSLMLLKRRDSSGSGDLIGDRDELVKVIDVGPR